MRIGGDEPIPGFGGTKDDFIHYFLFENGPTDGSGWAIQLLQYRGFTWTLEILIEMWGDEKKEVIWE